jgi:hypothetical protein
VKGCRISGFGPQTTGCVALLALIAGTMFYLRGARQITLSTSPRIPAPPEQGQARS